MPADLRDPQLAQKHGDPAAAAPFGAILVGGRSTRMGAPKALLSLGGRSLIEHVAAALAPLTRATYLLGDGAVPPALASLPRIGDAPQWSGPLAGVVAALRAAPDAWWLVVGCDQPCVRCRGLEWLIAQRTVDCVAVVPRGADGIARPLPGLYHSSLLSCLSARETGMRAPGLCELQRAQRVAAPLIPAALLPEWESVNTRAELRELRVRWDASENCEKKCDLQHFFERPQQRGELT